MKALEFLKSPQDLAAVRVAIVTGAEGLLRDRVIERLLEAYGTDLALESIDGPAAKEAESYDLGGLLDTLRTRSLFGDERVLRIRRADALVKAHADRLIRFFEGGEACHRVIFEGDSIVPKPARGGEVGGGKKSGASGFAGLVEKSGGVVVFCDALYDTPFGGRGPAWQSDLTRWVVEEARFRGKELSPEDAFQLHQFAGTDLRELSAELDKLALYTANRPRIAAGDIEAVVGVNKTSPSFAFAEAVASADARKAFEVSAELFERGIDEGSGRRVTDETAISMMLAAATASKLRRIGAVVALMKAGESFDDAASAVRTPPMFREQLRVQVEAWKRRSIRRATEAMVDLDKRLKSGGGPPRVLVDRFVADALGLRRAGAAAPVRRRT